MNTPTPGAASAFARASLLACACAAALRAQTATPAPTSSSAAPTSSAAPAKLEAFEVTGSLIKRTDVEGPSPVRFITGEEIDLSGMDNLTDVMRDIPEATTLGINGGGTTSFVRGASAIDLRFLGPNNTLVLVDGRPGGRFGYLSVRRAF